MVFGCAGHGRSRSLDHLLRGSAEIVVLGQVLRLGCGDGGPGQDRGSAVTIRAGTGDPITGVDVIRAHGTCRGGNGSGKESE